MIPTSALLKESARYSQTTILTADIMRRDAVVYPDIPVTDGSFEADRGNKVRTKMDLTVSLANHPELKINNNVHRVRVKRGYTGLGFKEEIQHGIFRIDDLSEKDDASLEIQCSGLESYIVNARFIQPRTPPRGVSTVQHITSLIQEVLPGQVVSVECTQDAPILATAPWERERWDAIDALASSIGAEVFVDYRGYFVIRDIPLLDRGIPVYRLEAGAGGTLIERDVKWTRDRVYNASVVAGQSSDPNVPPVWGWAYDSDPASPTYFYGDYGQVPRFFSSPFFTTDLQCSNYAQTLLASAMAANQALSVTALPLTFLEPGDVIEIVLRDGSVQRRLLEKISFNLGYDAAVSIDTLLMKDSDGES